jgi:hypothetical protein
VKRKYTINAITGDGVDDLLKGLEEHQHWIESKIPELCERLATIGATYASIGFARAFYDGPRNCSVRVEQRGENTYAVIAEGEEVLFVEFGSGVTMGGGHPDVQGYGPGTYPPTNPDHPKWNDPNGWYIPKNKGGGHTFGNPPNAPMYHAAKNVEEELEQVVREVFGH